MKDLAVTSQGTVKLNVTVEKYRLIEFHVDTVDKEIIVGWEKGAFIDSTFQPISMHKTVITNSTITTDGILKTNPVSNPYNTLIVKINDGDFTPESTLSDFMEYILTTYADV